MYCHPCVLISCILVPIPTPSFGALIVLLEIYPYFLATPLRSSPRPLHVVIALGVRDLFSSPCVNPFPTYLAKYLTVAAQGRARFV